MSRIRAVIHCHSIYSKDCGVSLQKMAAVLRRSKIDVVALTDHDEIKGALELQKMAPRRLKVVVGEEISSAQGDIIGLFLEKKVEPDQDIKTTIKQIKSQGGLVLLPHPFDRFRRQAVGPVVAEAIKNEIDFVELFNSRNLFDEDNLRAQQFAQKNGIPGFVGSDAHTPSEYPRAVNIMEDFEDENGFKSSLRGAKFNKQRSGVIVHLMSRIYRMLK